jgi:hypothetical protein
MPQQTKSMPFQPDSSGQGDLTSASPTAASPAADAGISVAPSNPDALEHAPGFAHQNLEGWIPPFAGDAEIRVALEQAFDYRGDVTLTLKDGSTLEGYVFDRRSTGPALADAAVRLFPKDRNEKVAIPYDQIARIQFTGRDTAAGKSFETWVRKYREKKAAGEKNIQIEPEKLD